MKKRKVLWTDLYNTKLIMTFFLSMQTLAGYSSLNTQLGMGLFLQPKHAGISWHPASARVSPGWEGADDIITYYWNNPPPPVSQHTAAKIYL